MMPSATAPDEASMPAGCGQRQRKQWQRRRGRLRQHERPAACGTRI